MTCEIFFKFCIHCVTAIKSSEKPIIMNLSYMFIKLRMYIIMEVLKLTVSECWKQKMITMTDLMLTSLWKQMYFNHMRVFNVYNCAKIVHLVKDFYLLFKLYFCFVFFKYIFVDLSQLNFLSDRTVKLFDAY